MRRLSIVLIACIAGATACTDSSNSISSGPRAASTDAVFTPTPSGLTGRILFSRSDQLFTIDPDGTDEVFVHDGCCARWSPDGTRVAYPELTEDHRLTTGIVDADGSGLSILPIGEPGLNLVAGAWSPDATRVALQGWKDGDRSGNGVYTSAVDGSDVIRLTTNRLGSDAHPGTDLPLTYSPDGTHILFQRTDWSGGGEVDRGRAAAFIVATDGTGLRRLTSWLPGSWGANGDWSPDGTRIVYDLVDFDPRDLQAHYRGEIYLIDADGTHNHMIDIDVPDGVDVDPPYFAKQPSWSPDGARILFTMWPEWDTDGNQLFTMAPDGSDLRQITSDHDVEHGFADWTDAAEPI